MWSSEPALTSRRAQNEWGYRAEVSPVWCSSKENEAGASSAGCVEARSAQVVVRAKPCALAPAPGRAGESSGPPNQGRHRGTPPRIARVPSMTARDESHRTSSSPVGRHDRR